MANTHTPLLGLTKQIVGENPDGLWGSTLNTGFMDLVEEAIAGRSDINVTGASITLTSDEGTTNQSRPMVMIVGGTPGTPRNVIVPTKQKLYIVSNEADDVVTIKTTIGAGVAVAVGDMVVVYVDQTLDDVIQIGSSGDTISPAPVFSLPLQPGMIVGATGPFAFPGVTVSAQGSLNAIINPFGQATVTVNDVVFRWVKTDVSGGTPDGSVYTPAPAIDYETLFFVIENGTLFECYVRYFADGLSIECFKCDGSPWVNGSVRTVASGQSLYDIYSTV